MGAAGSGGGETAAEPAGELGVGHRREGRCLLMAHLDEAHPVTPFADGLHDAVDAVAGQAVDGVHAESHECVDEYVCTVACHLASPAPNEPVSAAMQDMTIGSTP